jgi:hypothetical protein
VSETSVIVKEVYPIVAKSLDKNINKFKNVVAKYIEERSKELFEIAPYDRIFFRDEDVKAFFNALEIDQKQVMQSIQKTYYWKIANFNPRCAKSEFVIAMMMVIRYFYLKKMEKETELATIYLSFSGQFYPSIHSGSFPVCPPREHEHVMAYVINNELSNKYDIKAQGSVFNAIKSIDKTWLETYADMLKQCDDDDVVYLIQQLHNRIKSFMKNIAEVYYKVYDEKDRYMTYDNDSVSDDNYHIADNDSLKIERVVENTMTYIANTGVDYNLCKLSSDTNVKTDEIKSIFEGILTDNNNIGEVRELVRLIVTDYFANSKTKDVRDVDFITKSITPKPNSKEHTVLRAKEIIESWLSENSPAYRKRRSRAATRSSYYKSIMTYVVLVIHNANK